MFINMHKSKMAVTKSILQSSKLFNSLIELSHHGSLQNAFIIQSVRSTKYYNPRWKLHRQLKVQPVDLSMFDKSKRPTREEFRSRLKEMGLFPARQWNERPLYVGSSREVIEPYEPPEADGKASLISGAKSVVPALNSRRKSWQAVRQIQKYDEDFTTDTFPQIAQEVYIRAHEALMSQDQEELSEFTTEKANEEMLDNVKLMTIKWSFIESLEPPKIVRVRTFPIITENNLYSQVTVRFHTKQKLAIYDRFGRLMHGSEILAKDVLEYVVFEKHIVDEYGTWKLHAKIIPDWQPKDQSFARTYRKDIFEKQEEEEDDEDAFDESEYRKDELAQREGDKATVEIIKKKERPDAAVA